MNKRNIARAEITEVLYDGTERIKNREVVYMLRGSGNDCWLMEHVDDHLSNLDRQGIEYKLYDSEDNLID